MPAERLDIQPVSVDGVEQPHPPTEAASNSAKTPELVITEAVRPPPEGAPPEIEIVDIATLEEERRERRRRQNREAQRRWRKNHPEAAYQRTQQWRQKPDVRARAAAYARAYRQRQNDERSPSIDVGGVEE